MAFPFSASSKSYSVSLDLSNRDVLTRDLVRCECTQSIRYTSEGKTKITRPGTENNGSRSIIARKIPPAIRADFSKDKLRAPWAMGPPLFLQNIHR